MLRNQRIIITSAADNQTEIKMNKEELLKQIQECLAGRRGWISLKKCDKTMKFKEKEALVKQAGLQVQKHGRYGYTAFR